MVNSPTSIFPAMGSSAADLTSRVLRHERLLIAATVLLLTVVAWAYLVGGMVMSVMEPPLTALIAMWWLMMLAMMLPSASPAILLYVRVRETRGADAEIAPPWFFLAGYLVVWLAFSIGAALCHSLLTGSSMAIQDTAAQGAVLIGAGVYQLSPMKFACLKQCRSPGQFISRHWQGGSRGAVRLGVMHGAYCVGCCWTLMALLFVGGVMNMVWVVGLTMLVAAEKLLPAGRLLPRVSGIALVVWGAAKILA